MMDPYGRTTGTGTGVSGMSGDMFGAMSMNMGMDPEHDGDLSGVIVVGADGVRHDGTDGGDGDRVGGENAMNVAEMVEQPAKVMRIGSMIKQLLEEVRAAPLDEASRVRLREIHHSSIAELEKGLAPELVAELERLSLPFAEDEVPSESELRIAQAQLVGWLEGLFHGIQTALFAQQMAARAQLEQIRRALPPGSMPPGMPQGHGDGSEAGLNSSGPYL
jgi:Protein of unknown function (DUF2587)